MYHIAVKPLDEEANGEKFVPQTVVADFNKVGTLTGLMDLGTALEGGMGLALSDYDFESEDASMVDIAVSER